MPRTGRPKRNDKAVLLEIAEVVLTNPQIAISSAIRTVITDFSNEQSEEAAIRRLRDKFNSERSVLLSTVHRNASKRRFYFMSPFNVSFEPTEFFNISTAERIPGSRLIKESMNKQMSQTQLRCFSPEMQRFAEKIARASERASRIVDALNFEPLRQRIARTEEIFNTPEMKRVRETFNAASNSLNTPEMKQMAKQLQRTSNFIHRLNEQRLV